MELKEARQLFREIGFKLKLTQYTFGPGVTIVDSRMKAMPGIFFNEAEREPWVGAINLKNTLKNVMYKGEHVYGLGGK